ncbi:serine hydrolase domain-containing protein [Actinomadura rubrisoli]|uniref:serine hydrolase domain-containing protein n=1 Tax=Actinomadura rubrisoli TaxID=2530368 RepID=UPI001404671E|nr:serine hydrolase domain-containing protein [Actinomadura rubrisoli]
MFRRSFTVAATAIAAAVALAPTAQADPPHRRPDPAVLQRDLQDMVATEGAVAARVTDGQRTWSGRAGAADPATGEPVARGARFRVGSTTKALVATVMLQLQAERRVDLGARVDRYLPGLLPGRHDLTVRRLLNHTSRLKSHDHFLHPNPTIEETMNVHRWHTYTPRELVAVAVNAGYLDKDEYFYSNTNYVIAGMIIEKVTGRSYAREAERRILRPLGLRDTYFPGTSPYIRGPHTQMFAKVPGYPPFNVTEWNQSYAGASGELISTSADLVRFNTALLGGRLLPPAQMRQMTTLVATDEDKRYGLGLEVTTASRCGVELWGHNGSVPGGIAFMAGTRDNRTQVALTLTPGDGRPSKPQQVALFKFIDDAFCGTAKR